MRPADDVTCFVNDVSGRADDVMRIVRDVMDDVDYITDAIRYIRNTGDDVNYFTGFVPLTAIKAGEMLR